MATAEYPWERALGAVPGDDGTVEFRVWAPHPERVDVRVGGADHELTPEGYGIRSARVQAKAGDDYVFVVDGRELPDPASRWHGIDESLHLEMFGRGVLAEALLLQRLAGDGS